MNMGAPSHEVIEIGLALKAHLATPRAIDLGSGAGRNSVLLGSLGFAIEAVERDQALLSELSDKSKGQNLNLTPVHSEVQDYCFGAEHELCLLLGILHFLPSEEAFRMVRMAKSLAVSDAIHIITISDSTLEVHEFKNSFAEQGYLGSIRTSDVLSLYSDWTLLALEKYVKIDSHKEGEVDEHPISKLVFSNSKGSNTWLSAECTRLKPRKNQHEIQSLMTGFQIRDTHYQDMRCIIGEPDFDFKINPPGTQDTLLEGVTNCTLRACFWGTTKAYLENEMLVGIGLYETEHHYRFQPKWHKPSQQLLQDT